MCHGIDNGADDEIEHEELNRELAAFFESWKTFQRVSFDLEDDDYADVSMKFICDVAYRMRAMKRDGRYGL